MDFFFGSSSFCRLDIKGGKFLHLFNTFFLTRPRVYYSMGGIWEVNMNWGILKNRVSGLGPEPFERRSVLVCQWCRALVVLVALMAVSSLVAPESFAAPDKMASKTAAAKAAPAGAVGAKKAVPANKTAAKPASKTVAKAAVNPKDPKKVVPAAPKVPAVKKAMASARVKNMQKHAESKNAKWTTKNSTEMGFIPYDFVFAQIGKECYCKVFFRYLMPR